jgi:hypothetical protein
MFPLKHIEMLANWKCSKTAAKWILKPAVQLTAFSIKLTAARTEILITHYSMILFTRYSMILFNSIFSSASRSIIWFRSFRFNQKYWAILFLTTLDTFRETHFPNLREKNFKPTRVNWSCIKTVKIIVKKL